MAIIQTAPNASRSAAFVDWKTKQVLVVDDFFSFRNTVKNMLRTLGITNIDEASNGEDAIALIGQKKYDIVMCDYNLGEGKDGQQVLEEARYRGYINHATIFIMATAENTMNMLMGVLEYQPDDYLVKPFTRALVDRKLKEWVANKETLKGVEKLLEAKEYEKAIALCDGFISANPKNLVQFLKLKGAALTEKGDYPEAAAFYQQVLAMGNLPWARLNLGKIKFTTGEYEEARAIFEEVIRQNDKIVVAYDWLAKIHEKYGDLPAAQKVLQSAIAISPKAILRQQVLGEVAYRNGDLTVAEQSFKEAVKQGKHSVFKKPSDYTTLAKVLAERNAPEASLNVLIDGGKEFMDNPQAALEISVQEVLALKKLKREREAGKAMERVSRLSSKHMEKRPTETELQLAKVLILMGDEANGQAIVKRLIQSNHENEALIREVETIFKELDLEAKGEELITAARDEVTVLNNDGVKLVREENLESAIELFEQAVTRLPENKIINANAAQAFILYMKKNGMTAPLLGKARECLDRVRGIDPAYKDLGGLQTLFRELVKGA